MFAAKPSYTCCSSSPKISHASRVAIFGDPVILMAHILLECRNFTLSVSLSANMGQEQKAWFLLLRVIIKNIKPQTHGKSQRSEIFVNKAAEPRRKRAMPERAL